MFKKCEFGFSSKINKPFITEKFGPKYEGENWIFYCDKKDYTYDEAWAKCNKMIESVKEEYGYDLGFIHKQFYNGFRHKFGVLFGRKLKGDK